MSINFEKTSKWKFSCLSCFKEFDKLTTDSKCPYCQSDKITANIVNVEDKSIPKDSVIENIFVRLIVNLIRNLNEFYHTDKFIVHSFILFLVLSWGLHKLFSIDVVYALGITLLFIIMRKRTI